MAVAASGQESIIAFLSSPASYPHAAQTVEKIETHGAMVFLAGDYAYKMKKAVSFPYMDYGTLERRQQMCAEEIRRNRRTAPDLYLKTLALVAERNTFRFEENPSSPVAEWLVMMRRFNPEMVLDRVAGHDGLSPELARKLAAQVVRFHRQADVVQGVEGAEAVRATILGNDGQFGAYHNVLPRERTEALTRQGLAIQERHKDLLQKRAAGGQVRRCHGDLHLRNICLMDGEPLLFDCIEFNDAFADIDVLYDLAFLLMDLRFRGFRQAANRILEHYISHTGEDTGLVLLPLFQSMRAAVRSHVAVAISLHMEGDARTAMEQEANAYLELALDFLKEQQPSLIAIGGLSGSGKTTLAFARAARDDNAIVLRTDVLRKAMAGVEETSPLSQDWYRENVTVAVYDRLYARAAALLTAGYTVIADGVFLNPEQRERMEKVATGCGAAFHGIWLKVPAGEAMRRLEQRKGDASDATGTVRKMQEAIDSGTISWEVHG